MFRLAFQKLPGHRYSSTSAAPRVIFSGIQPTGTPHLGNFLGAILSWVKLQNTASPSDQLYFSVVGWHALTLPQNPDVLRRNRREMIAVLLASGLDHKTSCIFHQDHVQDHIELAWLMNCFTPVGRLRRMTSWKSRLADSRNANSLDEIDDSLLNTGLLTYPILQAADIMAYRATHVPVGVDQSQHLELARFLATTLNRTLFNSPSTHQQQIPIPKTLYTPTPKILSLHNPSQKMSKSNPNPNSRILLTDPPELIERKIKAAVTDSELPITWDPETRLGVGNLLSILASCLQDPLAKTQTQEEKERYMNQLAAQYPTHKELKSAVSSSIINLFAKPRDEYLRLIQDEGYLDDVARDGARRAKTVSSNMLRDMKMALGLI